jgi:hypothetical protein
MIGLDKLTDVERTRSVHPCIAAPSTPPLLAPPRGRWRYRTHIALCAYPAAVPRGRRHVRDRLREWRIDGPDVELIASELLTNSLHATPVWPVDLFMFADAERRSVLIMVWDASPTPPALIPPDDASEGGRGLLIVDAVSKQWGWRPGQVGKIIWSLVEVTQETPELA